MPPLKIPPTDDEEEQLRKLLSIRPWEVTPHTKYQKAVDQEILALYEAVRAARAAGKALHLLIPQASRATRRLVNALEALQATKLLTKPRPSKRKPKSEPIPPSAHADPPSPPKTPINEADEYLKSIGELNE